jgi:hypothetical protein
MEPPLPNSRKPGPAAKAAIIAILALGAAPGAVAQAAPGGLEVSGQWFRFIMASRPAAGYFTLSNPTATPRRLTGASSPGCGMVMLHRSVTENGIDRMVMVPSVTVPPHGSLKFAPGGYHLMCMQPTAAMQPGKTVAVTLKFSGGGSLSAPFPVRGATGK